MTAALAALAAQAAAAAVGGAVMLALDLAVGTSPLDRRRRPLSPPKP